MSELVADVTSTRTGWTGFGLAESVQDLTAAIKSEGWVDDALAGAVTRHCDSFWAETAVPRLSLVAADEAPAAVDMMYTPMICFVASGAKRTTAGDRDWLVGVGHMFVSSLEVPITATPISSACLRIEAARARAYCT